MLASNFDQFPDSRRDVVIRRIHFPKRGMSLSGEDDFRRLGEYRSNNVNLQKGTLISCDTPHVEIYAPDQKILSTDACRDDNDKSGLAFLNICIAADS
jgi:hypothetical protein